MYQKERLVVDAQGPSSRSKRYGRLHGKLQLIISEGVEPETSVQMVEKIFDRTLAEMRLAEMREVVNHSANRDTDSDRISYAEDDSADLSFRR